MRELEFISELDYEAARAEPIATQPDRPPSEVDAHYVAEMVRAELYAQHGDAVYGQGLRVTTTIDSKMQLAANEALRRALRDYDGRHAYRGPEGRLPPEQVAICQEHGIEVVYLDTVIDSSSRLLQQFVNAPGPAAPEPGRHDTTGLPGPAAPGPGLQQQP